MDGWRCVVYSIVDVVDVDIDAGGVDVNVYVDADADVDVDADADVVNDIVVRCSWGTAVWLTEKIRERMHELTIGWVSRREFAWQKEGWQSRCSCFIVFFG